MIEKMVKGDYVDVEMPEGFKERLIAELYRMFNGYQDGVILADEAQEALEQALADYDIVPRPAGTAENEAQNNNG